MVSLNRVKSFIMIPVIKNWYIHWGKYLGWAITILMIFPACTLFTTLVDPFQQTLEAIQLQETALAQTRVVLTQRYELLGSSPVETSEPFVTEATLTPPETIQPVSTVQTPQVGYEDPLLRRRLNAAKILLFEDMSASRYTRYVKEALDKAGYFYLDVGSAKGWFKTQLLSSQDWDLIIAAAEARRDFGGEFFEYINDHIENGTGAIIEFWDMDFAPYGKIKSLLDRCGVKVQSDWYEPDQRNFYWLAPENPIFHQPNPIPATLGNVFPVWKGDVGDLLEINRRSGQPTGDAVLLAGTQAGWQYENGTLVSCVEGRVIIQTFSSHEYRYIDMIPLWQNYIYNVLENHFRVAPPLAPTPVFTSTPLPEGTPVASQAPHRSGINKDYNCGDAFLAKVTQPIQFTKDLFEHHATGVFLVVKLQLINKTFYPFQIWDEDYLIEGLVGGGRQVTYSPHKAATGFLYIDLGGDLSQDVIHPGVTWSTWLAFDVDPKGGNYSLVVKPGSEMDEQVCEVRIPLGE